MFRNSKKKPICTPKTINEAANAVTKATKLIPRSCCPDPGRPSVGPVGASAALLLVVVAACVDVVDSASVDEDNIVSKRDVETDAIVDNVSVTGSVTSGVGVAMLSG